jgi:hypothetical protein
MSIQFRTRSQTVVDYSRFVNGNGSEPSGCCYVYDAETNSVTNSSKTVSECNQLNGYFLNGTCDNNITITPSTKGCCCACKNFPETGSYLKNTTFCECQDISGLWTSGSCPESETPEALEFLCISAPPKRIDHRKTRACCHPEFTTDGVIATCTDVCTEKECAEKAIYPYSATFYKNGRKCFETVGDASPAINECSLNTTFNGKVVNSCVNGTNIYSWSLSGFVNQTNKFWYDSRLPGKFIKASTMNTFWLESGSNYNIILGPTTVKTTISSENEIKANQSTDIKKICPGGYSLNYDLDESDRWFDGYFAIIDSNDIPVYYASPIFKESFNPEFSPIPSLNQIVPAIDLIATRTFSAFIDESNTIKIFGRFFDGDINEYRVLTVTDKLKKLYQHNVEVLPKTTTSTFYSLSTVGFVGQKLDGKFEYYSPFVSQSAELQQIRNMIRSMPPKDYVQASLGAYTFCGIDSEGTMTCVSLNSEIEVPLDKKFKFVTCSNQNQQTSASGGDPMKDFCYAVDTGNRIVRLSSTDEYFDLETEPKYSTTDVRSISCYYGHCDIVVQPDPAICNSQMVGSCCTCTDGVINCATTTQGECLGLFTSGGICCGDNPTDNCTSCSEIVNLCGDNSSEFLRITQSQTDLPVDELTYYKDGLYVGIFEPGVPVNVSGSTVRGNQITGVGSEYKPKVVGYGTTTKKWAIIVSPTEYEFDTINDATEFIETIQASLYDGRWNTYGDLDNYFGIQSKSMETLRKDSRLSGWYLPSKNELEFINYKMNHGFMIPELFKSFENDIYLSSTPYFEYKSDSVYNIDVQNFGGTGFMYGQSFNKLDYGSIYLVPRTKKVNVRLIKRIELE